MSLPECMNFAIAGVALWIAYLAYRAAATVWIQLLSVDGAYTESLSENASQGFHHFDITIRNRGLTMQDVKVCLSLMSNNGNHQFQLQRVQFSDSSIAIECGGEFKPGMVGRFSLKSYQYPNLAKSLDGFCGARKNDARIRIYTQGFLVFEARLWHRCYWLRSRWNALAFRVNRKFDKAIVVSDGRELLKLGCVLPLCNDSQFRIESFVEAVNRQVSRPA